MSFLEIKDVAKQYGRKPVLTGINLSVAAGQHLLLTGPSGGGKTTLLRLIAGLEAGDAGQIELGTTKVSDGSQIIVPPHKRGIAMIFQDLGLWPNLSVRKNVEVGLSGQGLSKAGRTTRVEQALEQCEIKQFADSKPGRLSGGEQQRTAFARALATRPRLLLMDEPFNGIDLILRRLLMSNLLEVAEAGAASIIWVSHHPRDALLLGASIAVLEDGHLKETGQYETLIQRPQSQTMKAWMSEGILNPIQK